MARPAGMPFKRVYRSALVLTDIRQISQPNSLPAIQLVIASGNPTVHHWKDYTWRVDLAKLSHWLANMLRQKITTTGWELRQVRGNVEIHFTSSAAAVLVKLAMDSEDIRQFLYQETITWET